MEWISVNDRLPSYEDTRFLDGQKNQVLVCLSDETVMCGKYENGNWFAYWLEGIDNVYAGNRNVTHWMELPIPPTT